MLLLPITLLAWPILAIFNRIRGRARLKPEARWFARLALGVVTLDAILSVLLLAFLLMFPFMINGGWLRPTPIMPMPLQGLLKMPLIIGILTAVIVVITIAIAAARSWPRSFVRHYMVLSLGAVLFVALYGFLGPLRKVALCGFRRASTEHRIRHTAQVNQPNLRSLMSSEAWQVKRQLILPIHSGP